MSKVVFSVVMLSLIVFGSGNASAAFVCPAKSAVASAEQERAIAATIPAADALDDSTKLKAAVAALRAKGIGNAMIVDHLIASYCANVAREAGLNEEQKRAQVRRFAARTVRLVYGLESADAVILDVPFRPGVIDAINARAAAERISPEAWVANAIDRDLKAVR